MWECKSSYLNVIFVTVIVGIMLSLLSLLLLTVNADHLPADPRGFPALMVVSSTSYSLKGA